MGDRCQQSEKQWERLLIRLTRSGPPDDTGVAVVGDVEGTVGVHCHINWIGKLVQTPVSPKPAGNDQATTPAFMPLHHSMIMVVRNIDEAIVCDKETDRVVELVVFITWAMASSHSHTMRRSR